MKTTLTAKESGSDFSYCFAVSSPLLGFLLTILALAIFCR
jgi:hypothetical protein